MLTDGSFLPGVQVVIHSLQQHERGGRPIVVMVTPNVPAHVRTRLVRAGRRGGTGEGSSVHIQPVPHIPVPASAPVRGSSHVPSWSATAYTKLSLWALTAWDKVVYVDGDMLVCSNIDDLFHRPGAPWPAASPDIFPPDRFNAGLLVVEPSRATFASLLRAAATLPSYDGGDTGLLNAVWPDWYTAAPAPHRLPFAYNAQRLMHWMTHGKAPGYWAALGEVKVIHYSSSPKPWDGAGSARKGELEMMWWQSFIHSQMGGGMAAPG